MLVEAIVAVALVAVCAAAALTAAAAVTHATARAFPAAALSSTAQNVLTDLRAATAYDPDELAALVNRSVSFEASEPAPDGSAQAPIRITAAVTRSARTDAYVGSVTARASDGNAVTVQATLVQEAPAPGSVIPASTPPPSDPALPPADGNSGSIQL
jgi:type II secretory pathway pseudopilin PulG